MLKLSAVVASLTGQAQLNRVKCDEMSSVNLRAIDRLNWLLDAPLFVDELLVDRLYDAVVRPQFEVQSREVGHIREEARKALFGGEASADYQFGLSFLTGKLKASGKVKGERERSRKNSNSLSVVESPVTTPGRRLEEIAAVYISECPERVILLDSNGVSTKFDGTELPLRELEKAADNPPRTLIFIEVAPSTPIMPVACELESGRMKLLFQDYTSIAFKDQNDAPTYPSDQESTPETRAKYWKALAEVFCSRKAMEIVEASGAVNADSPFERLAWIDFRLPFGDSHTVHLHCVPDGRYHTGVFGYNFVRRGYKQGVRLIGTLKAGLDINVLAVFDR